MRDEMIGIGMAPVEDAAQFFAKLCVWERRPQTIEEARAGSAAEPRAATARAVPEARGFDVDTGVRRRRSIEELQAAIKGSESARMSPDEAMSLIAWHAERPGEGDRAGKGDPRWHDDILAVVNALAGHGRVEQEIAAATAGVEWPRRDPGERARMISSAVGKMGFGADRRAAEAGVVEEDDRSEAEIAFDDKYPPEPPEPISLEPLMRGPVKELADRIVDLSFIRWPGAAQLAALTIYAAVAGRGFEGETRLRTGMMLLILSASGAGKSVLIRACRDVLEGSGLSYLIGAGTVTSDTALHREALGHPRILKFIDETGDRLAEMTESEAAQRLRGAWTLMRELSTAEHSTIAGKGYARACDDLPPVVAPCLVALGVSTPEQFDAALSLRDVANGTIARFAVFDPGPAERPVRRNVPSFDLQTGVDQQIAENLKRVDAIARSGLQPERLSDNAVLSDNGMVTERKPWPGQMRSADPTKVAYSDAAHTQLAAFLDEMFDDAKRAEVANQAAAATVLRRAPALADKVAITQAVANAPHAPQVTSADVTLGVTLARWSARTIVARIRTCVADSQHQRLRNEALAFILRSGAGGASKTALGRGPLTKVDARTRDRVLEDLVELGEVRISETRTGSRGRPTLRYIARKYGS